MGEEPATFLARQEREKAKGLNGNGMGTPLAMSAKMWPTPATRDHKGANGPDHLENGTGRLHLDQLPNFVEHLWYTPNVPNGGRTLSEDISPTGMTADGVKRQVGLENQARLWATPRGIEGEKGGRWQQSGDAPKVLTLTGQALSLPDRPISTDGDGSSHIRRTLNPLFVEWLMGWPPGWTSLALTPPASTGFGYSATALSAWKQRMRSALSSLGSPLPAPPVQFSLLGLLE